MWTDIRWLMRIEASVHEREVLQILLILRFQNQTTEEYESEAVCP